MKKVLITGISGFLGNYLYKYKPGNIQLTGTYFANKPNLSEVELIHLDLLNIENFINSSKNAFDIVIHCAAQTSLSKCEQDADKVFLINSDSTAKLAKWSSNQNSRFVFLSTDIVFDGGKGNYTEKDIPNPINYYGKSKFKAEQKISQNHNNAVIVRLALCLGKGLGDTKNFVDWFLTQLENDEAIPLFYDEFRTPVSAKYASQVIWKIVLNNIHGIVHLAGKDKINRYDLGFKMLDYLKSEKHHLLQKISSSTSNYPRPKDVSMRSNTIHNTVNFPQEDIDSLIENIL